MANIQAKSGHYLVDGVDNTLIPGVEDTRYPSYQAAVGAAKDLVRQSGRSIRLYKVTRKGLVEVKPAEVVYNSGK